MLNTVEANYDVWNRTYRWVVDGEEWTELADYCGQPYDRWCASVVDCLIRPFLRTGDTALEIGPGHGRWLQSLADLSGRVVAVDLSEACIDRCRERFADRDNIRYMVNDGRHLTAIEDGSISFAFSFEAFVHMDLETISGYFTELRRVLAPGGSVVLHHAGRLGAVKPLRRLRHGASWQKNAYTVVSLRRGSDRDGWRSDVSRRDIVTAAASAGLAVIAQTQQWGAGGKYNVRRFNDWISILTRPDSGLG